MEDPFVFVAEEGDDALGGVGVLDHVGEKLAEDFEEEVFLSLAFDGSVVVDAEGDGELVAVLGDGYESLGGADESVLLGAWLGIVGLLLGGKVEGEGVAALLFLLAGDRLEHVLQSLGFVDAEPLLVLFGLFG